MSECECGPKTARSDKETEADVLIMQDERAAREAQWVKEEKGERRCCCKYNFRIVSRSLMVLSVLPGARANVQFMRRGSSYVIVKHSEEILPAPPFPGQNLYGGEG